jgi:hypothetical protein
MAVFFVRPVRPEGYGERLLLASIIRRAAYDIALYKGSTDLKKRRLSEDAFRWIMNDRTDYFTAFVTICEVLDQDPQYIRSRTMKLEKKDVRKFDMVDLHGRV